MATFRTTLPPVDVGFRISHRDGILCMGSCFAEHIGEKLRKLKFSLQLNPFGILYNPVSLSHSIDKILSGREYREADLFQHLGLWHSFDHHGRFSNPDLATALHGINTVLKNTREHLRNTNRLVITLGTANVFVHKTSDKIVANCHKLPGQVFERRRLSPGEVATTLSGALNQLKQQLPALEVLVTVSPVRHLRDGLVENQRSKATLLLGLEEITTSMPFVHYFPSYEILLDDLRDYRFYEKDMAHPSGQAVDYIWSYFEAACMHENTRMLCREIDKVNAAASHRPFHPASEAHQHFLRIQLQTIDQLVQEHPYLHFDHEKQVFRSQILK